MSEKDVAEVAKLKSEILVNRGKFVVAVIGIPIAITGAIYEYNRFITAEETRQEEAIRRSIEDRNLGLTSQTLSIFGQFADDKPENDIPAAFLLRGLEVPALPFIAGAIGDPHPEELKQSFFESYLAIASGDTYDPEPTKKNGKKTSRVKPNAPKAVGFLVEALNRNWHTFLQAKGSVPNPQTTVTPYIDLIELWLDDIAPSKDAMAKSAALKELLEKIEADAGPQSANCRAATYAPHCVSLKERIGAVLTDLGHRKAASGQTVSADGTDPREGETP